VTRERGASAWPVLAAYGVAFAACLVAGQQLVLALARHWCMEASQLALSLRGLAMVAGVEGAILIAIASLTARWMDPPAKLGLGASRASAIGLVASVVAVSGLSFAGGALVDALGVDAGPVAHGLEEALERASPAGTVAAIVALALVPGFAEETFFRGLMQTRLAAAWGRWPGILAAAACFGAFHLDVVQGALALVVGVLLGWIASRFESIRPAALAHAINNALFVALAHFGLSDARPRAADVALILGAIAAIASIAVVRSPRAIRASTPAS
jgi:membrane protease YdiL (CAAX protease family)